MVKTVTYVCEPVSVEETITANTVSIAKHHGRYSNSNGVGRYCGCICHCGHQIMHFTECCDDVGRQKDRREYGEHWHDINHPDGRRYYGVDESRKIKKEMSTKSTNPAIEMPPPYRQQGLIVADADAIPKASDYKSFIEHIMDHAGSDIDYHNKRVDAIIEHARKNIRDILIGSHTRHKHHCEKLRFPFHKSECRFGWAGIQTILDQSLVVAANRFKTMGEWKCCIFSTSGTEYPLLVFPLFGHEKRFSFDITFIVQNERA